MGLETVIVAFFVIGTIVVVASTLTLGANHIVKSSYEGYVAFSQTTMDRLHTNIKIVNSTLNETDQKVQLTIENTGETKLSDFAHWDVIVAENGEASYLKKDAGFDVILNNSSDLMNPGILDPGESIDLKLSNFGSGNLSIKVVTENGIASFINYK
jgi:flagellar protein FlaF